MKLFEADPNCDINITLNGWFLGINSSEWRDFNDEVSVEEIKQALFDMSPYKALGQDGFHAVFYQKMWDIVGVQWCSSCRNFFRTGAMPKGINDTLVV